MASKWRLKRVCAVCVLTASVFLGLGAGADAAKHIKSPRLVRLHRMPSSRPLRYRLVGVAASNDPGYDTIVINNRGEIALALNRRTYTWRDGKLCRLFYPVGDTAVNGLDNLGQVVGGTSETDLGAITSYPGAAILWKGKHPFSLGSLPDFSQTIAVAINNRGQIVGTSGPDSDMKYRRDGADADENAPNHIFLWEKGRMADLGKGKVAAINDAGQIAGTLPPPLPPGDVLTDGTYAAVWAHGKWHLLASNHNWAYSRATGMNRYGSICGYVYNNIPGEIPSKACLWSRGKITLLGVGHAWAINGSGQVVGSSGGHAVLWWRGCRYDLNLAVRRQGWVLQDATGINGSGQIVGGEIRHGQRRMFLLTPTR